MGEKFWDETHISPIVQKTVSNEIIIKQIR
jgi:hypothetical protein